MNELELIENKDLRITKLDRIEVLDRVGGLILIPSKEVATTKQLSEYFNISLYTLNSSILSNMSELLENGMRILKDVEFKQFKTDVVKFDNSNETKTLFNRVSSLRVFNRRAILNIAFLLTESDVALKIRDIVFKESPELYAQMSNKEKQLRFKKYEMEMKNYLEFSFGKGNVKSQIRVGKYNLDFILFDNIHIEVDENGHSSYNNVKEL